MTDHIDSMLEHERRERRMQGYYLLGLLGVIVCTLITLVLV